MVLKMTSPPPHSTTSPMFSMGTLITYQLDQPISCRIYETGSKTGLVLDVTVQYLLVECRLALVHTLNFSNPKVPTPTKKMLLLVKGCRLVSEYPRWTWRGRPRHPKTPGHICFLFYHVCSQNIVDVTKVPRMHRRENTIYGHEICTY